MSEFNRPTLCIYIYGSTTLLVVIRFANLYYCLVSGSAALAATANLHAAPGVTVVNLEHHGSSGAPESQNPTTAGPLDPHLPVADSPKLRSKFQRLLLSTGDKHTKSKDKCNFVSLFRRGAFTIEAIFSFYKSFIKKSRCFADVTTFYNFYHNVSI